MATPKQDAEVKQEFVMVDARAVDRRAAMALAAEQFEVDGWKAVIEDIDPSRPVGQGLKDPADTARDGVIGDVYPVRFVRGRQGEMADMVRSFQRDYVAAARRGLIRIHAPNLTWVAIRSYASWTAWCPELQLEVIGDTYGEMASDIGSALDAWARQSIEDETLDASLQRLGWTKSGIVPETDDERSALRIDIPYRIV